MWVVGLKVVVLMDDYILMCNSCLEDKEEVLRHRGSLELSKKIDD